MTASSSSRLPCAPAMSILLCSPGQQLLFELLLNGEPLLVPLPSPVWDSSHMARGALWLVQHHSLRVCWSWVRLQGTQQEPHHQCTL